MKLEELLAKPVDRVEFTGGYSDTWPNVRIGGQAVAAEWLDDVYSRKDEPVAIAKIIWRDAPATFVVIGSFTTQLRQKTGTYPTKATVTVTGSTTVTVTSNSVDYVLPFLSSYTPAVNDQVRILWQGSEGTVLGKLSTSPTAPPAIPPTAPPPAAATTGRLSCPAVQTGTWSNAYGWATHYNTTNLYQGDGSVWGAGSVNNGAWFYGGKNKDLAGKTLTRVQFRVPARLNAGATSSALTMHLYTHSSDSRPSGDVTRTTGPFDVTLKAGFAGGWIDLDPATIGATLKNGGGLGISGNPYMGLVGIGPGKDPASGQLLFDYTIP